MDDSKAILGYWKLIAVVQDDVQLRYCDIGTIFQFTEERFIHVKTKLSFEYDLYPEENPKAIDKFIVRSYKPVQGIYELNGDELRILFHSTMPGDEQARPKSLTGIRGHPFRSVHVYQRSSWRPKTRVVK